MPVTCDEDDGGKRCVQCNRPTILSSTLSCDECDESAWRPTLRSGQQPSEAERATLDAELATLRESADAHEKELQRIRARLDTLQPYIDRRVCLLHSPIRRLPDELLEEVLLLLWHSRDLDESKRWIWMRTKGSADLPALLPSHVFAPPHVCSWWRTLTLSRPALRPCIYIPREALMAFEPNSRRVVPERLSRSLASLPYREFNIHVMHMDISPDSAVSLNRQLLHTHRWRRAALDSLPWTTLEELATSPFPHLQHMHITLGAVHEWHDASWIGDGSDPRPLLLGNAHQLTSISLETSILDPDAVLVPLQRLPFVLPWSQLRIVHAYSCPLRICLEILSQCSLLHSLEWRDERDEDVIAVQDVMPVERIDASIRHVAIRHHWAVSLVALENFLEWINMPNLIDLEVCHVPSDYLLPRLGQYGCHLTSLTLVVSVRWMSPSDISNILEATPELESLAFVYDSASTQELEDLGEEMHDTMEGILQALCDTLTLTEDSKLPPGSRFFPDLSPHMHLRRLRSLSFRCEERCFDCIYSCMLRDWPPDEKPVRHLKEVRLATPLSPKNIGEIRDAAAELCLEVYGLDTCSAMYETLLPHDWQPPTLTSRKDNPNPPEW
ncbi:uncharacterized protein SCHCODRAFT_02567437 [Schizophyllum commune H4-8]|uniref:uncharacterized protein n=1 Tax=Schizophyllum commune (strain H4-8 / FGSC 9210) TaxID=578458 RepID=UPI0021607C79|nr:uncharacterized protein SCHCODRAFT_02567437 [Schizophyllum commune H4-8]KAI5898709.1 hypothetical protein SCHCODRAFT_02567437 [Schizophyllum commune H4-8]